MTIQRKVTEQIKESTRPIERVQELTRKGYLIKDTKPADLPAGNIEFNTKFFNSEKLLTGVSTSIVNTVLACDNTDSGTDGELSGTTYTSGSAITGIVISNGGTSYQVGDALVFSGGGGSGAVASVATVSGAGEILAITLTDGGSGYTSLPDITVTSAAGSGAELTAKLKWTDEDWSGYWLKTQDDYFYIESNSHATLTIWENPEATAADGDFDIVPFIPDSMVGADLNPNTSQSTTFTIVRNTETQIYTSKIVDTETVPATYKSLADYASAGDTFSVSGYYAPHKDDFTSQDAGVVQEKITTALQGNLKDTNFDSYYMAVYSVRLLCNESKTIRLLLNVSDSIRIVETENNSSTVLVDSLFRPNKTQYLNLNFSGNIWKRLDIYYYSKDGNGFSIIGRDKPLGYYIDQWDDVIPDTPTHIGGTAGKDVVKITFRPSNDINQLGKTEVYRSEDDGTTYEKVATLPPDARDFSDIGVTPRKTYKYKVKHISSKGQTSSYSSTTSVTTLSADGYDEAVLSVSCQSGSKTQYFKSGDVITITVTSSAAIENTSLTVDGNAATLIDSERSDTAVSVDNTNKTVTLDAGASAVDDYYNNMYLSMDGEVHKITDYDGATQTATVDGTPAWSAGAYSIDDGDTLDNTYRKWQYTVTGSETEGEVTVLASGTTKAHGTAVYGSTKITLDFTAPTVGYESVILETDEDGTGESAAIASKGDKIYVFIKDDVSDSHSGLDRIYIQNCFVGLSSAVGTGELTDDTLIGVFDDDYWNGYYLRDTAGNELQITDYAAGVFTLDGDPVSGTYWITKYKPSDSDNYANWYNYETSNRMIMNWDLSAGMPYDLDTIPDCPALAYGCFDNVPDNFDECSYTFDEVYINSAYRYGIFCRFSDKAGNYSDLIDDEIYLDQSAPAAPANVEAHIINGTVSLEWDANTEIDVNRYTIYARNYDSGDPATDTFDEKVTISAMQSTSGDKVCFAFGGGFGSSIYHWKIGVTAIDIVGNESDMSAIVDTYSDPSPPEMSYKITLSDDTEVFPNENNWYNDATLQVKVYATDEDAGLAGIYYRTKLDDGAWSAWSSGTTSPTDIALTNEGINYIQFYAIDNAGNKSEVQQIMIQWDKTAPTWTPTASITGGFNRISMSWTGDPADSGSGISHIRIYRNTTNDFSTSTYIGKTTTTEYADNSIDDEDETYYYWGVAEDIAGNTGTEQALGSAQCVLLQETDVDDDLRIKSPYNDLSTDSYWQANYGIRVPIYSVTLVTGTLSNVSTITGIQYYNGTAWTDVTNPTYRGNAVTLPFSLADDTTYTINFDPVQTAGQWKVVFDGTVGSEVEQLHFNSKLSADEITAGVIRCTDGIQIWSGSFAADGSTTGSGILMDTSGIRLFNSSDTTVVTLDGTGGGKITAGSGDNVGVLDGNDATYRIYAGNATPADAPFRVTQAGALIATGATISGTINATAGEFSGDITLSGALTGGTIRTAVNTAGRIELSGTDDSLTVYSKTNVSKIYKIEPYNAGGSGEFGFSHRYYGCNDFGETYPVTFLIEKQDTTEVVAIGINSNNASPDIGDVKFYKNVNLSDTSSLGWESGAQFSQDTTNSILYLQTYHLALDNSLKLYWGDGALSYDTNLYRSAANILKTDDAFDCNSLKIGGAEAFDSSGYQQSGAKTRQKLPFGYATSISVNASLSTTKDAKTVDSAVNGQGYRMLRAGKVTGISLQCDCTDDTGGGSIKAIPQKNGINQTMIVGVADAAGDVGGYSTANSFDYSAGDTINVEITVEETKGTGSLAFENIAIIVEIED